MDKIVYVILILLLLYTIKRDFFTNNVENFETQSLSSPDDANSINTLAQIAKKLMDGGLTTPGNLIVRDNLDVSGNVNITSNLVVSSKLDVSGNANIKGKLTISNTDISGNLNITSGSFNLLPRGIIVAWNGTTAPFGWAICNGTSGTPNLKDKFIVGSGNKYALDASGGNATIVLTPTQLPPHKHVSVTGISWGNGILGDGDTSFSDGGSAQFCTPAYRALSQFLVVSLRCAAWVLFSSHPRH